MKEKSTNELQSILNKTRPDGIRDFLAENRDSMFPDERPFADYMRGLFKSRKMTQQQIFSRAGIPERYGYKLISGAKKTLQRDIILRICIAAGFSLKETQTALTLYSMPTLYPKIARDSVIIIALNQKFRDVDRVDELMKENGFPPLVPCGAEES